MFADAHEQDSMERIKTLRGETPALPWLIDKLFSISLEKLERFVVRAKDFMCCRRRQKCFWKINCLFNWDITRLIKTPNLKRLLTRQSQPD